MLKVTETAKLKDGYRISVFGPEFGLGLFFRLGRLASHIHAPRAMVPAVR
jgi:hypothetical protein